MRYSWIFLFVFLPTAYGAEEHHACPYHAQHQNSNSDMRGDAVMGFCQEKSIHHFLLRENGGVISVEAKDSSDAKTVSEIRMHLQNVAKSFASGDFRMPHAVHLQDPPGSEKMRRLTDVIRYRYEETKKGAMVKIETDNVEALTAVQEFIRFQIQEHHTGDPLENHATKS